MKKVFGIIALSMALFACGGNKNEQTVDSVEAPVEEVAVAPTLQMGEWKAGEAVLTLNEDMTYTYVNGDVKKEGTYAFNAETMELTTTPKEGEAAVLMLTEAGLEMAPMAEGEAPTVFIAPTAPAVEEVAVEAESIEEAQKK